MAYPVSERFWRAVQKSHDAVCRVDVSIGDRSSTLRPLSGSVVYDFDDQTRRSLDTVVIDETGTTFREMQSLTDPFVAILKPFRGIKFATNDIEWCPLGEFFTDNLTVVERDGGAVVFQIAALDESSRAQRAYESPKFVPNGTPIQQAIPMIIQHVWPRMRFELAASAFVTPNVLLTEDSNPWAEALRVANSGGFDLYLRRSGACVMGPRPYTVQQNPTHPALEFVEGANATFWNLQRRINSRPPNVVVAIGTNTLAPSVRGIAEDLDPYSPTYVHGRYGREVRVVRSELLVTNEMASAYAQNKLSRLLGPQDESTFECVPNPAIDEADTISITRERMGMTRERRLVSHLEIPLDVESPMLVTGRRSVSTDGRIV